MDQIKSIWKGCHIPIFLIAFIQGVSAKTLEPNMYLGYLPTDFYEI
jgi:hypothetical protein